VRDVPRPAPDAGEVLVEVRAAGINISEAAIRAGAVRDMFPARFPSGQGSDFAGVVAELGSGVDGFTVGDEVIGFSNLRSSHAEYVTVPATQLTPKPAAVPWEVAGALPVAGFTAWAAVRAVALSAGDTLVVSGAAGGVGSITVQLGRRAGATVIGLASEQNHGWLSAHGVVPVAYGDGAVGRIRKIAPKADAFIDTYGGNYVELALGELAVPPDRVDTIVRFDAVEKYGVKSEGNAVGASAAVLAELASLIAAGELEVPIAGTYPLTQVREAYTRLASGHVRGKIALLP
jgi:NADPH:quinone reductase-like Zn-dependent oxidoreductase